MKKLVCGALLLSVAGSVQALPPNQWDQQLLKAGLVDKHYNVVNENKFREALSDLNRMIKEKSKSIPFWQNNQGSFSFTPTSVYFKVILSDEMDKPMSPEQLEAYREYNFYNVCNEAFGTSEVFRKRNMKIIIDIYNRQNEHRFKQEVPVVDCAKMTANPGALSSQPETFQPLIPQKLPE